MCRDIGMYWQGKFKEISTYDNRVPTTTALAGRAHVY